MNVVTAHKTGWHFTAITLDLRQLVWTVFFTSCLHDITDDICWKGVYADENLTSVSVDLLFQKQNIYLVFSREELTFCHTALTKDQQNLKAILYM